MKRGEMIRVILDMAWSALSEEDAVELLNHYNLNDTDIREFLDEGQRAINDIDEQFASGEPV